MGIAHMKGGGGFTPNFCENTILKYELAMMARKLPMWGMEQKWGPKTKILSKEIELSFLFHSIRLDSLVILVYSFVKIEWKMAKLWPCEARATFFERNFELGLQSIFWPKRQKL